MGNVAVIQRDTRDEAQDGAAAPSPARTAVERVFGHWVFMLGKSVARTALGPLRRRAIERALELYDEDVLLLAIEGCAASAWHAGDNDRRRAFDDLSLILRDEEHVERFAEMGQRLRDRVRERDAQARTVLPIAAHQDAAAIEAGRERLRDVAAQVARRRLQQHGR